MKKLTICGVKLRLSDDVMVLLEELGVDQDTLLEATLVGNHLIINILDEENSDDADNDFPDDDDLEEGYYDDEDDTCLGPCGRDCTRCF